MKCSFCEQPLACKACAKPFVPRDARTHAAVSQPDMQIYCPECQAVLICRACGFVYGVDDDEDEP